MNRTLLRRIAIAAAVVVALLVVAGAIFTASFDVNRYQPQIIDAVQQRTGRTLRFDGDLSLSLFPRIAVRLPATTLSEPGREAVFARFAMAQASVALLPLLRGQFEVDGVRVDGLQATIVKQKDGRTSVDDLLRPPKPAAVPGKSEAPAPAGATTIGAVRLEDADITWRDLAAGRTVRLSEFDLRAGRYAPGVRMPVEASAAITASEPAFTGKATFKAGIEWNAQGGLRAVRDLALTGDGTLKQQPVTIDARADLVVADAGTLDVRGLKVGAGGKGDGGVPFELQLTAPRLEASQARASGERIELAIARRGAEPLEAKVLIEGVRGNAARLEAMSVKISGSARSGPRSTRFDATTALVASVDDRTLRFDRASGEVVIEDPAFGTGPVRLPLTASGAVDGPRETVALQFETRGEGLSARGKVSATGFAAPRIAFDVDAEQVDADRYFLAAPERGDAPAKPAAPTAPEGTTDAKVDLGALRDLNAAGSIRIAQLRAKGIDYADLRATVNANGGRLDVAPFSVRVHGGSVSGRVGLDARGNRVAAAGSLSGIQLRRLLGDVGGRAAIAGRASGTFDLAAAGSTVNQMKRALGGALALEVRDGALVGIDLADLIGTASGLLQSRGRQTGALDENKRTPFSQLSATVRIRDGIATNDDLKAKSPQFDIAGSGRMDLVSTELDYTLRSQVLSGPAIENSPLRALGGITVPVKISGLAAKPSYAVDWAPVAAELLLRRAAGRGGSPAVNQLLEGLGSLLQRKK